METINIVEAIIPTTTQKNKLNSLKNSVLKQYPNAIFMKIKEEMGVYNHGINLSKLHLMPAPKSEQEAWLNASYAAAFENETSCYIGKSVA